MIATLAPLLILSGIAAAIALCIALRHAAREIETRHKNERGCG